MMKEFKKSDAHDAGLLSGAQAVEHYEISRYGTLIAWAEQLGFTDESFNKCVGDQSLITGINAVQSRAEQKFGVNGTPTFFVNGVKQKGGHELKDFDDAIAPFLKS